MSKLGLQRHNISTNACGPISAYIHGSRMSKDIAVMSLHDLGCNHNEFFDFLCHPHMTELANRCFWIHVEVPGQGDNEPDLPNTYKFPTMQKISEGLSEVCDSLNLKHVVLIGDGAGANILARLAMAREDITLGTILIHCTGTTAGFLESLRDKVNSWKLKSIGMNPSVESYLMLHRFGIEDENFRAASTETELKEAILKFKKSLQTSINPRNLNKFIQAFMIRTNITDSIGNLKVPVLFLTGSLASFNHTVHTLYKALLSSLKDEPAKKANIEILEIEGVANVMKEKPEKVAECVQNFLQGLGIASGAINRRMSSTGIIPPVRNRSDSMDLQDQPKGVTNIFFNKTKAHREKIDDVDET